MRIAYVSSEVHPFSKTGGLADVSAALPAALTASGVDVTVLTPCYRSVAEWLAVQGLRGEAMALPGDLWVGDVQRPVSYRVVEHEGLRVVLIVNEEFYGRPSLYVDAGGRDYPDNAARYAFFCRAVLEYYCFADEPPALFHVHDWQSALIPVYLETLYRYSQVAAARSLLTIHNLGYQGIFPAEHLYATGLGWDLFHPEGLEFYGKLNVLKGGILYADAINTVSPTYAKEIQTEAAGKGLDGVIHAQRHKLSGILNGIDPQRWDPATDPHLPARYEADDLAGKSACKRVLQQRMALPVRPEAFLLGVISRMDAQKGISLILEAIPTLHDLDLQLVVLGAGTPALEDAVRRLARAVPDRVAVHLGFDEPLAHLIEAGADAFLMPSEYEPCGLNQMYSQRYGAVPIVRETGGLKDTVTNLTPKRVAAAKASGFTFTPFTAAALAQSIRRAAHLYREEPATWRQVVRDIMRLDHSWGISAQAYVRLYQRIMRERPAAPRGA